MFIYSLHKEPLVTILDPVVRNNIKIYINATIDTALNKYDRSIITDLMIKDTLLNPERGMYKPFHQALIPTELFRFQGFFRSLETSIGAGIFEFMAKEISLMNKAKWLEVKKSRFSVTNDRRVTGFIDEYIESLESQKKKGQVDYSLPEFPVGSSSETVHQQVDLYLKNSMGEEYFIEIKSPKPNKDQCKATVRKLLKFKATYPSCKIIYGLTFNPYGEERSKFKNSYIPYYFDINDSETLKIGSEFWDFLGGDGVYQELLEVFSEIMVDRKDEIKQKLMG